MDTFDQISPNQAMRALTAAAVDHHGTQIVRGHLGAFPVRWPLTLAVAIARGWDGPLVHDGADRMSLLDSTGTAAYQFTAPHPDTATSPGPDRDIRCRPRALRLVRVAS